MTEKRYKSIGANIECSNGMEYMLIKRNDGFNVCQVCSKHTAKEIVDELNSLAEENEQLKKEYNLANRFHSLDKSKYDAVVKENEQLRNQMSISDDTINDLISEIEQLKSELSRYKEVNRLDIWKSSYSSEDALITELQNKCNNKQEHIVILENKIHRMREAIHKLEWLASHRNADLKRENWQLKQILNELSNMLQFDVEHGIRSYPVKLSEYLINALKELKEND